MRPRSIVQCVLLALVGAVAPQPFTALDQSNVPSVREPRCDVDEELRDGQCVVEPVVLKKTRPRYPKRAKKAGVEATVKLRVVIQKSGDVTDIKVVDATPEGLGFEKAATRAVRRWKYRPARVDGKITEAYFDIVIEFLLR